MVKSPFMLPRIPLLLPLSVFSVGKGVALAEGADVLVEVAVEFVCLPEAVEELVAAGDVAAGDAPIFSAACLRASSAACSSASSFASASALALASATALVSTSDDLQPIVENVTLPFASMHLVTADPAYAATEKTIKNPGRNLINAVIDMSPFRPLDRLF